MIKLALLRLNVSSIYSISIWEVCDAVDGCYLLSLELATELYATDLFEVDRVDSCIFRDVVSSQSNDLRTKDVETLILGRVVTFKLEQMFENEDTGRRGKYQL